MAANDEESNVDGTIGCRETSLSENSGSVPKKVLVLEHNSTQDGQEFF